jgi:hypothetical protein
VFPSNSVAVACQRQRVSNVSVWPLARNPASALN